MAVPSGLVAGAPVIAADGSTLPTSMVFVSVLLPPSSSVTVSVTTYSSSSPCRNENVESEPLAKAAPSLVTDQAYVNVSAEPASLTDEPKSMVVPSGLVAGAPVIEADGSTLPTSMVFV